MDPEFEHCPAAVDIAAPSVLKIIRWASTTADMDVTKMVLGIIDAQGAIHNALRPHRRRLDDLAPDERVALANTHILPARRITSKSARAYAYGQTLVASWIVLRGETSTRAVQAHRLADGVIDLLLRGRGVPYRRARSDPL